MLNKSFSLSIVMFIALAFCVSAQTKMKEVAYFYDEDQKLYGFNDPVTGEVVEINSALEEKPELINEDAYGEGWIIKINITDASQIEELLSASDYEQLIAK